MKADPKLRVFEVCLQQIRAGSSPDEALSAYPEFSQELRPMLEAAHALHALEADVRREAARPALRRVQARDKARFLQAAQAIEARSKRSSWLLSLRFGMALAVILLVVIMGTLRTVAASSRALPGETLYPIKLASEHARLLLASSQGERLELERDFDRERADEVESLLLKTGELGNSGQSLEVRFVGGLSKMGVDGWRVDGITVQVPADARVIGDITPGIFVEVSGVLQPDGTVLAHQVQARLFEIDGLLERVAGAQWWIDNVPVRVTPDTILMGNSGRLPPLGTRVEIEALIANDGTLLARVVEVVGLSPDQDIRDDTPAPVKTVDPTRSSITSEPPALQPTSLPQPTLPVVVPTAEIPADEPSSGIVLPLLKPDGNIADLGDENNSEQCGESLTGSGSSEQGEDQEDSHIGPSGGGDDHHEDGGGDQGGGGTGDDENTGGNQDQDGGDGHDDGGGSHGQGGGDHHLPPREGNSFIE